MPLLQLRQLTLRYTDRPLLDNIDLQVDPGERVCLVGRNGSGKTSLMRVISGEEKPQQGEIIKPPGVILTRLPQEVPEGITGSVLEVVRQGLRIDGTEEEWEADVRQEDLMEEMNLPESADFQSLSGGMKRRVLLARALVGQPDVLLLDEPTNHLDLESILWLENFLLKVKPTLFFVTHDRTFLRKLSTRIVELDRGHLTSWACDFETYLERKAAWLAAEEKNWAAFDKKLALEEAWIRQGVKARRTRNEGRVHALKAMRAERTKRRARTGSAKIEIQEGNTSGQKVIEASNVSFQYGDQTIVRDFSTTIWRGDKIGIIGPNGTGKTTLLKLLLGQLAPTEGEVKHGTKLQIVYLDQLRDQIDDNKSLGQNVAGDAETVTFQGQPRHIHSYLKDFLFESDRIRMPAKMLSGGERNRLLLARLFLQPANVLVLDEPTNDLDAETLELLEEILLTYDGTLLLVSHDRSFLDNVVTSTLVFEGDGIVTEYTGGYEDWVRQRDVPRITQPVKAAIAVPAPVAPKFEAPKNAKIEKGRKFLNREQKELDELPAKIEALETQQIAHTNRLADPATYQKKDGEFQKLEKELHDIHQQIEAALARWEELEKLRTELAG